MLSSIVGLLPHYGHNLAGPFHNMTGIWKGSGKNQGIGSQPKSKTGTGTRTRMCPMTVGIRNSSSPSMSLRAFRIVGHALHHHLHHMRRHWDGLLRGGVFTFQ
ncbi:hypothetical protein VitviT2T_012279 [Vitis vinifera]|uniref:Uncharacterized protein n=1 Tax=Vitis vinifera TaxID=29760 RepID=A0ABY9CDB2_VITVI|nr:hypothetical protein VitviT2T_012279 [Vitis vinifera]